MKSTSLSTRILQVFLLALAAGLGGASFLVPGLAREAFLRGTYPLLWLLFFYWVLTLRDWRRLLLPSFRPWLRHNGGLLFFCLLLTAAVFWSSPPFLRVLSDEANLLSVSQSLADRQRPEIVLSSAQYGFAFRPLAVTFPIRPLMFPFLVHLLHGLLGYAVVHAFIINFIALWGLLSVLAVWIANRFRRLAGAAAALLVAAQPIVTEAATSAGFDLLNALFLLLALAALHHFLRQPAAISFRLLWVHLVMAAHIRYESGFYLVSGIGLLFLCRRLRREYFSSSLLFAWTPLLLLPLLWHRMAADEPYFLLGSTPAFSLEYFFRNTSLFFELLFGSKASPFPVSYVNLAGLAGLILMIYLVLRREWLQETGGRTFFGIAVVWLAGLWGILASYYYGDIARQSTARYYVPFFILLSVSAVWMTARFRIFEKKSFAVFFTALFVFIAAHGRSAEKSITGELDLPRRHRHVMNFLNGLPDSNFLIITDRPVHYTIHRMAAIDFEAAAKFEERIRRDFKAHLYPAIYIVQEVNADTGEVQEGMQWETALPLETAFEIQNADRTFIRISRVSRS